MKKMTKQELLNEFRKRLINALWDLHSKIRDEAEKAFIENEDLKAWESFKDCSAVITKILSLVNEIYQFLELERFSDEIFKNEK